MRLIQFVEEAGDSCLGCVLEDQVVNITAVEPDLGDICRAFHAARGMGSRLDAFLMPHVAEARQRGLLDYSRLLAEQRVLAPIAEPALARLLVSGTGLTHLGSARQRDTMHAKDTAQVSDQPQTDSQKMFDWGVAGGRPADEVRGTPPEWFYKGDGRILLGPGQSLEIPAFAEDGGEEPELVGIYIVDSEGVPCRVGFAQGNEWSDHRTEKLNYLYLAPSKLRTCSVGPELVTDLAFDDLAVRCRVLRDGAEIYHSGELRSGERNMCHSLANLEDHHFKFPQHRQPGDIHVHFFGTSRLSFPGRTWSYAEGDIIEVSVDGLGAPLRNPVRRVSPDDRPVRVERG
jgi:hypothetical protein